MQVAVGQVSRVSLDMGGEKEGLLFGLFDTVEEQLNNWIQPWN